MTDDRQTDRPRIGVGGIVCAARAIPPNDAYELVHVKPLYGDDDDDTREFGLQIRASARCAAVSVFRAD